jgi:hypothetical protein
MSLKARRGGAAYTITEECERLFCETLRAIFCGEKTMARQDSLGMGTHEYDNNVEYFGNSMMMSEPTISSESGGLSSSQSSLDSFTEGHGLVTDWLEVYDYVGGARFRGFIAEHEGERNLFVFFDQGVLGNDLKPGYVWRFLIKGLWLTRWQTHGFTGTLQHLRFRLRSPCRMP